MTGWLTLAAASLFYLLLPVTVTCNPTPHAFLKCKISTQVTIFSSVCVSFSVTVCACVCPL